MEMYTGLRVKVIIKEEYGKYLEELVDNKYDYKMSSLDLFRNYSKLSRSFLIPNSSAKIDFDKWKDVCNPSYDRERREWEFVCALKNDEQIIQYFFKNILSVIVEEIIYLETWYEEDLESEKYTLDDIKKLFIKESNSVIIENYNTPMSFAISNVLSIIFIIILFVEVLLIIYFLYFLWILLK